MRPDDQSYCQHSVFVNISLKIIISYLLWVILTPLAYYLTKLFQSQKTPRLIIILQFLLGCVVLAVLHQLISSRLDDFINHYEPGREVGEIVHQRLLHLLRSYYLA